MASASTAGSTGEIIREPVGKEKGYWAGAPGAFYAADERAWYVTYRIRRPRGIAPDRGGEARIMRSTDLKTFMDVWSVIKDRYDTASIERSAIRKGADGVWRYWTSYVDPKDGRWCTAVIKGRDVAKLDAAKVERVFSAGDLRLEGVKDPWVFERGGVFYMFLSVAVGTARTTDASHSTLDIYNTGECASATGLAVSRDLDSWDWQGVVFAPEGSGWDKYCRRINSVVLHNGKFIAFYDGSASEAENYEERTGLAESDDLKNWRTLTPKAPLLTSPHASQSLRYIDAQEGNGDLNVFYEFAREDGAHDLRLLRTSRKVFLDALTEGTGRRRMSATLPAYLGVSAADLGKGQPVKVRVLGDMAFVARDFAETILNEILLTQNSGKPPTFIIPVGPVDQFPILARMLNEKKISCRDVMFINMDEYLDDRDEWVPANHPLSFRGYMDRAFYDLLEPSLAPARENRVFPDPRDPAAVQKLIDQRFGVDVCFGGIGINGHVAFNEPPEPDEKISAEEFAALPTRVLPLTRETRTINSVTVGGEISIVPKRVITVGMREILAARRLRFYCNRPWQSAVVRRVLHGPLTPDCPASFFRQHPDASLTVADYVAAPPNIQLR